MLTTSPNSTLSTWTSFSLFTALWACRDYRWEQYPARNHVIKHPQDNSLMTYRGHKVLTTLIRAYFSPLHTTAQRFIYAGSADGSVYIYGNNLCSFAVFKLGSVDNIGISPATAGMIIIVEIL